MTKIVFIFPQISQKKYFKIMQTPPRQTLKNRISLEDFKNSSQGELPGEFSPTVGDNPLGISSV
jgi:hypothetical protein